MPGKEAHNMDNARLLLSNLRQLREQEQRYANKAAEYLAMASRGMSARRATDTGGTGECPLSAWTDRYSLAKDALVDRRKRANGIWARIEPLLADADFDAAGLIRDRAGAQATEGGAVAHGKREVDGMPVEGWIWAGFCIALIGIALVLVGMQFLEGGSSRCHFRPPPPYHPASHGVVEPNSTPRPPSPATDGDV